MKHYKVFKSREDIFLVLIILQKSLEGVVYKGYSEKFPTIHRKTAIESLFSNVAGLKCTSLQMLPCEFCKSFQTIILKNTCERLLLS